MPSSLDLSLPETPQRARRGGWVPLLTLCVTLGVLSLLLLERSDPVVQNNSSEVERLEQLAQDLEKRTLYTAAAGVWSQYLEIANASPPRRAEIVYRRGKNLQEGGEYSEAARCFSEVQRLPLNDTQKRRAGQYLLECLSALGKDAARERVARAMAIHDEKEQASAIAVVAGDPITRDHLLDEVKNQVRMGLKAQGLPLPAAQLDEQAAKLAEERLKDTEFTRQVLQQIILRRVLYREGLERQYATTRELTQDVERFRRDSIASRVVDAELSAAVESLGATDISNHYEAHRNQYVSKTTAEFSFARYDDEASAQAAHSLAASGSETGVDWQSAPRPLQEGGPVPGIGPSAEIAAHIVALDVGTIGDRVLNHDGKFYFFRVDNKAPSRQLTLEEASQQVLADLANLKRREMLTQLEFNFRQKFFVQIYDENLKIEPAPTPPLQNAPPPSIQPGASP